VPGKVVAQLMGHANVDTTLNVYTQVLDGSLRAAADKVGSELFTIVHKPEGTGVPNPRALAGPEGETRISNERALASESRERSGSWLSDLRRSRDPRVSVQGGPAGRSPPA
jgi:hypothetical protein